MKASRSTPPQSMTVPPLLKPLPAPAPPPPAVDPPVLPPMLLLLLLLPLLLMVSSADPDPTRFRLKVISGGSGSVRRKVPAARLIRTGANGFRPMAANSRRAATSPMLSVTSLVKLGGGGAGGCGARGADDPPVPTLPLTEGPPGSGAAGCDEGCCAEAR